MKKKKWIFVLLWAALFLPFLILFFLSLSTLSNRTNSAIETGQLQFIQMLNEGDLKSVMLVRNQNIVEVTLAESALNKSQYQNVQELEPISVSNGPHYKFKIANAEVYHQFLEEAQRNTPSVARFDYTVEERSGIGSFITNWGIIFGLIFTVPVLIMWLVFKLFWSAKPKETSKKGSNHFLSTAKT